MKPDSSRDSAEQKATEMLAYLLWSLDKQSDNQNERATKGPPQVKGTHTTNSLGPYGIHYPGEDVNSPCNGRNLDTS